MCLYEICDIGDNCTGEAITAIELPTNMYKCCQFCIDECLLLHLELDDYLNSNCTPGTEIGDFRSVNVVVEECFSTSYGASMITKKIGNDSYSYEIYSGSSCNNSDTVFSISGTNGGCETDVFGISHYTNLSFVQQSVDESIFENNPQVNCNYGVLNFGPAVGIVPENVCLDGDVGEAYDDWDSVVSSSMVVCDYSDGVGQGLLKGYTS